jgi:putative phosphoserine phosphatase/1-acylglycerol-3-phosphate O-acyltransferase
MIQAFLRRQSHSHAGMGVPIVIRNAGELMWRDAVTIRRGRVDVVVHPAIPVSAWTTAELTERVAEVRQLYVDTLASWPGSGLPA